jgi:hypothetical protein
MVVEGLVQLVELVQAESQLLLQVLPLLEEREAQQGEALQPPISQRQAEVAAGRLWQIWLGEPVEPLVWLEVLVTQIHWLRLAFV